MEKEERMERDFFPLTKWSQGRGLPSLFLPLGGEDGDRESFSILKIKDGVIGFLTLLTFKR